MAAEEVAFLGGGDWVYYLARYLNKYEGVERVTQSMQREAGKYIVSRSRSLEKQFYNTIKGHVINRIDSEGRPWDQISSFTLDRRAMLRDLKAGAPISKNAFINRSNYANLEILPSDEALPIDAILDELRSFEMEVETLGGERGKSTYIRFTFYVSPSADHPDFSYPPGVSGRSMMAFDVAHGGSSFKGRMQATTFQMPEDPLIFDIPATVPVNVAEAIIVPDPEDRGEPLETSFRFLPESFPKENIHIPLRPYFTLGFDEFQQSFKRIFS